MLDDKYTDYYPLRAGLHRQSVLTDRIIEALKVLLLMLSPSCPPAAEREGDTFGCAGSMTSPSTPFRSATIILMSGRTPNKKESALHIHYLLAAFAKSYNNTT